MENEGLFLKKFLKFLTSRMILVALGILLQTLWVIFAMYFLSWHVRILNLVFLVLSIVLVFRMLIKWEHNPSYVLAWAVPMLLFPVFGITVYVLFGRPSLTKKNRKAFKSIREHYNQYMNPDEKAKEELRSLDESVANQSKYIADWAGFPLWKNTETKYYASGEDMFPDMLEAMKAAKHFIYMEFFIVGEGRMWGTIKEVLEQKVKEGVDVRFIYDDFGCVNYLPYHYYKELQASGIKCAAFNPFNPTMSIIMNNRNHRKILDIDGHTAFTGGINLADEYINEKERFGYWKDTGIRLKGDAAWSFTLMFIEMWNYITGIETTSEELEMMRPATYCTDVINGDGFVQPYADSPLDNEYVGENVYRNIISKAKRYCYIFTPYLVIGSEMMTTLTIAAKSGVDVRIVTPEIPDKKLVFKLTQSYYERLIKAGVKIYQFTPGFIHAKSFICDDEIATVGSINLDFRSLHMHFECGCWLYNNEIIKDIKADFLDTFEKSEEITLEFCKKRSIFERMLQAFLRLFAPLF